MTMRVSARLALPGVMPVLAVLTEVLSAEECAALIALARPRLAASTLVDPQTGRERVSDERQSRGMFFRPGENELVARIDARFAAVTGLPVSHGEGLQILHYAQGAGSAPHYDWLQPASEANRASIARSGQRICTLVAYLNDVPAGGETAFPELGWSVTHQRGSAVYFQSCDGQGQLYPASVHHSLPVTQGEKWVATKWTRTAPFVSA
ncbi:MAG: hypothetical protein DI603_04635 [Roseateles depolymerans]|uniref:Fe2OG dioxygenase domain-containing protein n=1 Tax=Roseateles depolymerans TaxID=76731 RepID=A0A2W5E0Z4_9BURK|nr:MAG: hypothetical protein DI603_04635 [Roseateles depolymerans]